MKRQETEQVVKMDNVAVSLRLAAVVMVAATALSGCSGNDYSDLRTYINNVKARPAGRVAPVPEFKTYETFEYEAAELRDPFKMFIADTALVDETTATDGLRPDMNRHKETLEQYPLDTLRFVGHLERDGQKWAIVTSPDHLVHRVMVGNHLGTNFGEIVEISESRIEIREIIPDGLGGWIERDAALSLKE